MNETIKHPLIRAFLDAPLSGPEIETKSSSCEALPPYVIRSVLSSGLASPTLKATRSS